MYEFVRSRLAKSKVVLFRDMQVGDVGEIIEAEKFPRLIGKVVLCHFLGVTGLSDPTLDWEARTVQGASFHVRLLEEGEEVTLKIK